MEYAQVLDTLLGYWPGGQEIPQTLIGLSLEEAYRGAKRTIEQDGTRLTVSIPPGVHSGSKIYLPQLSPSGTRESEFCTIVVHDHPPFKRCGDDLHLEFTIDAFTAILGGTVLVPTLFGEVTLSVPAGTAPGTTLRLKGLGMPVLGQPEDHGDLCVHLQVRIPDDATKLERKLIDDSAWLHGWRLGAG